MTESNEGERLAMRYGVPFVNLEDFDIEPEILRLVPRDVALKHLALPMCRAGKALVVAVGDPSNGYLKDDLALITGCSVELVVATKTSLRQALDRYYP